MIRIKIKFIIFMVIISIFAYFGGGNLFYSFFYSVVLILAFALIHIIVQLATMKIKFNLSQEVFKAGDRVNLDIVVKSFSIFPAAYIMVKNQGVSNLKKDYNGDITYLNYHKEKCFSNELEFKIRGVYNFSETSVLFTDLFCIMKFKRRFVQKKYIKVYPQIYKINESFFDRKNTLQNSSINKSISENLNEIRDLRLYRQGDSLKRVHWKLSAKHSEMYVKNFAESSVSHTNIILNMIKEEGLQEDYDLVEEQMIDLAVSLVNYLQTKRFRIKLFINNKEEKIFNIGNKSEVKLLMEYFLNNKSQGENDIITFINSKVKMLEQGNWIGIVTIKVDEALVNEIRALTNIGFKISVFYCRDNNLEFINQQTSKGLEFIKCEKAIF